MIKHFKVWSIVGCHYYANSVTIYDRWA